MTRFVTKLITAEEGAGLVEYGLIIALIVAASAGAVAGLGRSIGTSGRFNSLFAAFQ